MKRERPEGREARRMRKSGKRDAGGGREGRERPGIRMRKGRSVGCEKRGNQGEKGGCGRWERGVRKIGKAGRESKDAGSESQERRGAKDAKGGTCARQVGEMGAVRARMSGKVGRESKAAVAFSGKGSARGVEQGSCGTVFQNSGVAFSRVCPRTC